MCNGTVSMMSNRATNSTLLYTKRIYLSVQIDFQRDEYIFNSLRKSL